MKHAVLPLVATALCIGGCAGVAARPDAGVKGLTETGAPAQVSEQASMRDRLAVASADEGLRRGDAAYRAGRSEEAAYLYMQAAQLAPTDAAPLIRLGVVQEQKRNLPLAIRAYDMALAREPGNVVAADHLGLALAQTADVARAKTVLQGLVDRGEASWHVHNALGVIAQREGDAGAARAHFDAALEREPRAASVFNNRGYLRLLQGDLPGARGDLETALALGEGDRPRANLGTVYARQGEYARALEVLLPTVPRPEALNRVGEAALKNGDYRAAYAFFERAAAASPTYFERAHANMTVAEAHLEQAAAPPGTRPGG